MISTRTKLLLAAVFILAISVAWAMHRQHQACAATLRPGARRAPIASASSAADLPCDSLAAAPPLHQAIDLTCAMAVLALLRSLWIDRDFPRRAASARRDPPEG